MRFLAFALFAGLATGLALPEGLASSHCSDLTKHQTSQAGPLCCCFSWNGVGVVHVKNNHSSTAHSVTVSAACSANCNDAIVVGSATQSIPAMSTEDFNIAADKCKCLEDHAATATFTNDGSSCGALAHVFTWEECTETDCDPDGGCDAECDVSPNTGCD